MKEKKIPHIITVRHTSSKGQGKKGKGTWIIFTYIQI